MVGVVAARERVRASVATADRRLDWPVALLSMWIVTGIYVDGWAHGHIASTLETFFTPWHALLYSGVGAAGLFLFLTYLRGRAAGLPLRSAIPAPYDLSMVGFILFGIGGVLDLGWHTVFGIERGFEGILSPTHLLLFVSVMLIISGPLRAAWSRREALSFPAILSATLFLSVLTFTTHDMHPFTSQLAAKPGWAFTQYEPQLAQELGVLGIMLQSAILVGVTLLLVSRSTLKPGSLTFMFTVNAAAVTLLQGPDPVIIVGLVGGLVADGLLLAIKPSASRPNAFRIFAVTVPLVIYLLYFLGILAADGIWWRIHAWIGSIVLAGLTGLAISYLLVPPRGAAGIS